MKNSYAWAAPLGALIILFLVISIALVAVGGWTWFAAFLEGKASDWVQSVGSIAAILGAYSMGKRQIQAGIQIERARQAAQNIEKLDQLKLIFNNALNSGETIKYLWGIDKSHYIDTYIFERQASRALEGLSRAIDLNSVPPTFYNNALNLRDAVQNQIDILNNYDAALNRLDGSVSAEIPKLINNFALVEMIAKPNIAKCELLIGQEKIVIDQT